MRPASIDAEMQALAFRLTAKEAELNAALERQDWQTARECEIELSRMHSRCRDLERQVA